MAIKSTEGISETAQRGFPKLRKRRFGDLIVLFHNSTAGMVVFSGHSPISVGCYTSQWNSDEFDDYVGTILLENG